MIPLLKRLGFSDNANVPNAYYRNYRDEAKSKIIMAQLIRNAYKDLFATSEYAKVKFYPTQRRRASGKRPLGRQCT